VPMRIASWIFGAIRARAYSDKLRTLTSGISIPAYVVTALVWAVQVRSGILYPLFDAGNLHNSWGGPTLAGAWAAHFALGIGVLLVISFPFALWRARRGS
jgi:hypothetical protein